MKLINSLDTDYYLIEDLENGLRLDSDHDGELNFHYLYDNVFKFKNKATNLLLTCKSPTKKSILNSIEIKSIKRTLIFLHTKDGKYDLKTEQNNGISNQSWLLL